jgi:hypothetical protein
VAGGLMRDALEQGIRLADAIGLLRAELLKRMRSSPSIKLALTGCDGPRAEPVAEPVERCRANGCPWFTERPLPEVTRDTADSYAQTLVLSQPGCGLLTLQVSSSPRPLPSDRSTLGQSQWSGMSGAPVGSDISLVGGESGRAAREGPSTIAATPLSSLGADPNYPGWGLGYGKPQSGGHGSEYRAWARYAGYKHLIKHLPWGGGISYLSLTGWTKIRAWFAGVAAPRRRSLVTELTCSLLAAPNRVSDLLGKTLRRPHRRVRGGSFSEAF